MSTQELLYNIVHDEGEPSNVVVFVGGEQLVATREHENFKAICDYVTGAGDKDLETLRDLFDVSAAIAKGFARVGERVAIKGATVYMDLEPLEHDILTEIVVKFHKEGNENFGPLVAFLEKVMQNPQQHSRENLYRWLTKHRFMIAPDGDIIAYKGVYRHGDHWRSSHRGYGVVNGEEIENAQIPNFTGAVVEMPRSMVEWNPRVGCHTGLHVGNWRYASTFAEQTIRVKVNPRDVVSVPTDSSDEKMRVCRYVVMDQVTREDTSMFFAQVPMRTRVVTRQKIEEIVQEQEDEQNAAAIARHRIRNEVVGGEEKKSANAAKRAAKNAARKKAPEAKLPKYYEQYSKAQFESLDFGTQRWLAKEWGLKITAPVTRVKLVSALAKEAKVRLKTW